MFAPRNRIYSLEHCGFHMTQLKSGGCGGGGAVYGCRICEKTFIQVSGGLVQTPLILEEMDGKTIADFEKKDGEKDEEDETDKDKIEMA